MLMGFVCFFCSAFSLNDAISLLCALFAACNCAHRGSVAEHWSQVTVMTFTCESVLGLPCPQTWVTPVAARFRLVIAGGGPLRHSPPRALLACCLQSLFAVRHLGRGPLGPNAHF